MNPSSVLFLVLCLLFAFILSSPILPADEADQETALYYSANALYNRKLYSLAKEEYESFLHQYPSHEKSGQARLGLALCYTAMGQAGKALPLLEKLSRMRGLSNQQEIHNLLGRCHLTLDQPADAEKAFAWSVNNHDSGDQGIQARIGLIEAQYRQSKWEEVIQSSRKFRKEHPDSHHKDRIRFQEAVALFESRRFDEARVALLALADLDDRCPFRQHAVFLLAESYRELGQDADAMELYRTAARKMEGAFTAEALFRLGFVRFMNEDYGRATKDFAELLDEHGASPNAAAAKLYLGRCLLEQGDARSAERLFDSFSASSPEYGSARLWLARTYIRDNRFNDAERVLSGALDRVKDDDLKPEMLFAQGHARIELGAFREAVDSYSAINEDFPRHELCPEACWFLAYSLHQAGDCKESLDECEAYLSRHPDSDRRGEAFFLRAENLVLMDRLPEARTGYEDFLESFPDHFYSPSARFRTAQILYENKQWDKALQALAPLLSDPPESPFFAQMDYIRGDCLYHLEQWQDAVPCFTGFLAKHPEDELADSAALKTALALDHSGQSERAASTLETFVDHFDESAFLAHAWLQLGRIQYEKGRMSDSRRSFRSAYKATGSPEALYYLGYIALAENETDKALEHFNELTIDHPDHPMASDALVQQAVLRIQDEDFEDAEKILDRFLDNHGDDEQADEACFYLGIALSRQEKWRDAIGQFENVINRYDRSVHRDRTLYEWAWCERSLDRTESARDRYETLLEEFPESPLGNDVVFELAEMDYENKNYDGAILRLQGLLEESADNDLRQRVLYRLGWNCFSSGKIEEAARWFEDFLESAPRSENAPTATYQAGEARLSLKEYEPAYHHFRNLVDLGKDDPFREQALLRLGECAALTQRWQESENVYRRFEKEFPRSDFLGRALFGQGWALENREKYSDAIEAYERVLVQGRFDEISARSQFQIGECRFSMKQYDEAVKALIKVEIMYAYPSWSAKALLEVGRALELPGNTQEAMARYRELIDKYPDSQAAAVARKKLTNLEQDSEASNRPR
ncbi:MAG: tetratricopeptide repeat protein [Planctomycetota bacterium]|jgi:TolA-binding protein